MTKKVREAIKRLETEMQLHHSLSTSAVFLHFLEDIRILIEDVKKRRKHV